MCAIFRFRLLQIQINPNLMATFFNADLEIETDYELYFAPNAVQSFDYQN